MSPSDEQLIRALAVTLATWLRHDTTSDPRHVVSGARVIELYIRCGESYESDDAKEPK